MRFWINIFNHPDKLTENLLTEQNELLLLILKNQQKMGQSLDAINAALVSMGDSLSNLSADINGMLANQADGLTSEQAADVATRLQGFAEQMKATADIVPDAPVTEPPADGGDTTEPPADQPES